MGSFNTYTIASYFYYPGASTYIPVDASKSIVDYIGNTVVITSDDNIAFASAEGVGVKNLTVQHNSFVFDDGNINATFNPSKKGIFTKGNSYGAVEKSLNRDVLCTKKRQYIDDIPYVFRGFLIGTNSGDSTFITDETPKQKIQLGTFELGIIPTHITVKNNSTYVYDLFIVNVFARLFTVTFKDADGTELKTEEVVYKSSATPPSVTPTPPPGKVFEGWDKSYSNVSEDLVITAKYSDIKYNVSFDGNGATSGSTSALTDVSGSFALTANGFKREHTITYKPNYEGSSTTTQTATASFVGWSTSSSGDKVYDDQQVVSGLTTIEGATVTLYAKWELGTLTLPSASRTYYDFAGWYDESVEGAKIGDAGAEYAPSAAKTLYAHWTPINYTIEFNGNGSTSGSTASLSMTHGVAKNLTANGFSKTGHTFAGWATSLSGSVVYADKASVSNLTSVSGGTVTLYAVWTPNTYTVSFTASGGTVVGSNTKTVTYGSTYGELPSAKSNSVGFVFSGWYTAQTGGTRVTKDSVVSITAGQTLYARFAAGSYTVKFDKNGGAGTMADQTFTFGTSGSLTKSSFTRVHPTEGFSYDFLGWSTSSSGSVEYADGASVTDIAGGDGETVTLYAVWHAKTLISVTSEDTSLGTVNAVSGYYSVGAKVTIVATIIDSTRTRFLGWYIGSSRKSTSASYEITVGTTDVAYVAKFRSVVHYLSVAGVDADIGSVTLTVAGKKKDPPYASVECLEGDTVVLKASPAYNYNATSWTVGGVDYAGDAHTFVVSESDQKNIVCNASFVEKPKFSIRVSKEGRAAGACSVKMTDSYGHSWSTDGNGMIVATAYIGIRYSLTAELPDNDNHLYFGGWKEDGSVVGSDVLYSVLRQEAKDISLSAEFNTTFHTLNISSNYPEYCVLEAFIGNTKLDSLSGIDVVDGQYVTVRSTTSVLRQFGGWYIDGSRDSIEAEFRFQIVRSMGDIVSAVAQIAQKSRSSFDVTKENGGYGDIEVSYTDVFDPVTKEIKECEVSLPKDSNGEVHDYQYSGVVYKAAATVKESLSEVGNQLTYFDGWYSLINGEWRLKTRDLSTTLADEPKAKAVFAAYKLCVGEIGVIGGIGGHIEISPDTAPDVSAKGTVGPKWISGHNVKLRAVPDDGYSITYWRVSIGGIAQDSSRDPLYDFNPTDDFTAYVKFEPKKCPVYLSVDSHSAKACSKISAFVDGVETSDLENLVYGTEISFKAVANEGYIFGEWLVDGEVFSYSDDTLPMRLTKGVDVVARFKAKVSLSKSTSASAKCTLSITEEFDDDGNPVNWKSGESVVETWVVLGEKCAIRSDVTSGAFSAWFLADDVGLENPLELANPDVVVVYDNISYVSRIISENDYTYISLFNKLHGESGSEEDLGVLSLSGGDTVSEEVYNEALGLSGDRRIVGAYVYYRFLGTIKSHISAVDSSGRKFYRWGSQYFKSDKTLSEEVSFPEGQEADVFTNRNYIFTAYWGTPKPVRVGVSFCDGSRGLGTLLMDGETEARVETDDSVVDFIMQGERITIGVNVANGYMFDGWYRNPNGTGLVSKGQRYSFDVSTSSIYYAKFVEDRNAIYRWEGSEILKTLRWKSKIYASNKPFDPSCARIDADGYSVGLKVEMFSSPDKAASGGNPSAIKALEVSNQNARRLPKNRPERFCQIDITASHEIDAVIIGTSMEEIAV